MANRHLISGAAALRIGTRGSPLALAQARLVAAALQAAHPDLAPCEIVPITTSGDRTQTSDRPLSESGNKGLFTKEIEDALLLGAIDIAVHSMKDMPTVLPDGLVIPCLLPREDVRDAFFSSKAGRLQDLPAGAVVGTSSLRRQALVRALRPDLSVVSLRGNVDTRLQKLAAGQVDATLLAAAGLNRLGKQHLITALIDPADILPAPAQGAVGVETRGDDIDTRTLLAGIHCNVTGLRVGAERAFLHVMDGSCQTPLAALATVPDTDGLMRLDVLSAAPDGSRIDKTHVTGRVMSVTDAEDLGRRAAEQLKNLQ